MKRWQVHKYIYTGFMIRLAEFEFPDNNMAQARFLGITPQALLKQKYNLGFKTRRLKPSKIEARDRWARVNGLTSDTR